jgi:GNAT superfamily N-acetyltransferase
MSTLLTRPCSRRDLPRLVEMNGLAYPDLFVAGVVFDEAQMAAQAAVFPDGQVVVESDGVVVGAIATLVVPSARVLAPHTWIGATSHGTFACHDPAGDALYLADVYSDPAARGRGVGAALYDALFALCRRKKLARVVAGGRLFGYHAVASQMTAEAYVDEVVRGVRHDRVLTPQLRAGFSACGVLPGYLDDWRSGSYASHLVWTNDAVAGVIRGGTLRPWSTPTV